MRVALDGLLLGGGYTGVEHSVEALIRALPAAAPEHQYTLACTTAYATGAPPSLALRPVPGWVCGRAGRIAYEQACLASLLGDADVLHAPAYVMPLNWRKPSVLTVYDLIALQFPHWCKRANAWHYGLLLPRSLRRATRIVVPAQVVADTLSGRFPEVGEKVRVVPLGVDDCYCPATPEAVQALRARLGLPERFVLYVGNLEPKKNLAAIIRAFDEAASSLPHSLVLQGGGGWKCADVHAALAAARHRDRILPLRAYLPPSELAALYTAADLLVQWSLYEGFGLPPLEAMACGTPALVSDGGALPEIAGPAALVVPLGPSGQLAAGLVSLLADEALRADLRRRGLQHAARFNWQAHACTVAALYEETVNA